MMIQECKLNNQRDVDLLVQMVSADKVYDILQNLGQLKNKNVDGRFTAKSTWSGLRIRAFEVAWCEGMLVCNKF